MGINLTAKGVQGWHVCSKTQARSFITTAAKAKLCLGSSSSFSFFKAFITFMCMVFGFVFVFFIFLIWKSGHFQRSVLTFYHVGPRDQTLSFRLGSKHIYPLSHLASPWFALILREI